MHSTLGTLARSLKLWSFYCDLEESLGTLESTRAVYDQILELRIATPQIILNYALFLQVSRKHIVAMALQPVGDDAPHLLFDSHLSHEDRHENAGKLPSCHSAGLASLLLTSN